MSERPTDDDQRIRVPKEERELPALNKMIETMKELDDAACRRVLDYLRARFVGRRTDPGE